MMKMILSRCLGVAGPVHHHTRTWLSFPLQDPSSASAYTTTQQQQHGSASRANLSSGGIRDCLSLPGLLLGRYYRVGTYSTTTLFNTLSHSLNPACFVPPGARHTGLAAC